MCWSMRKGFVVCVITKAKTPFLPDVFTDTYLGNNKVNFCNIPIPGNVACVQTVILPGKIGTICFIVALKGSCT